MFKCYFILLASIQFVVAVNLLHKDNNNFPFPIVKIRRKWKIWFYDADGMFLPG